MTLFILAVSAFTALLFLSYAMKESLPGENETRYDQQERLKRLRYDLLISFIATAFTLIFSLVMLSLRP